MRVIVLTYGDLSRTLACMTPDMTDVADSRPRCTACGVLHLVYASLCVKCVSDARRYMDATSFAAKQIAIDIATRRHCDLTTAVKALREHDTTAN